MDVFSNLMVIGECLLDTRRTQAFAKAIAEVVHPGDRVIDIGTGSGILSMFAARAGAKKVLAIEIADDIAEFAKQNIRINNLSKIVEVTHEDIKTFIPPWRPDVVIMELMDTGLVAEQQGVAMKWLQEKKIIRSDTRSIPYRYQCAAALCEYDFSFYGFHMPFVIQARNFAVSTHIQKQLSPLIVYRDIDFRTSFSTQVNEVVDFHISESGHINALLLKAKTYLTPYNSMWGTTDMNMPVIVPLTPQTIKKGEHVQIRILYSMGEGFSKFKATFLN